MKRHRQSTYKKPPQKEVFSDESDKDEEWDDVDAREEAKKSVDDEGEDSVVDERDEEEEDDTGDGDRPHKRARLADSDSAPAVKKKPKQSRPVGSSFQSLDLHPPLLRALLLRNFRLPTPIQRRAIPLALAKRDVVAMARTGSGKTLAFLIPIIDRLKEHSDRVGSRALVLEPTRELAVQTAKVLREISRFTDLRIAVVVGGEGLDEQFEAMASNPDIIVATPGRLVHLVIEMSMSLSTVEMVVFDEADRLFELGFAPQLREIQHRLPSSRQTMLFSATLPSLLVEFARAGLTDPVMVRLEADGRINPDLEHHVEFLSRVLEISGIRVRGVHGTMDPTARRTNLEAFREGHCKVLVVTDVAARGLDVPTLDEVVNYDFPPAAKVFVHRVGRAGRAGRKGRAWSLVGGEELPYLLDLQTFSTRPLQLIPTSGPPPQNLSYTSAIVLGAISQPLLDLEAEHLDHLRKVDGDMISLEKGAANAYSMYGKTRERPSGEGVRKSKEIGKVGVHPLVAAKLDQAEHDHADMVAKIASFRPSETVFEVGKRGLKSKEALVMLDRRRAAAKILSKRSAVAASKTSSAKAEDGETTTYTGGTTVATVMETPEDTSDTTPDPTQSPFFVPYNPPNAASERAYSLASSGASSFLRDAQAASFELTGEVEVGVPGAKPKQVWDKKKKRFVRKTIGADNIKRMRSESGALVEASFRSGRFQEWQNKTKTTVPRVGEMESAASKVAKVSGFRKFRHTGTKAPTPGSMSQQRKITKMKREAEGAAESGEKGGKGGKGKGPTVKWAGFKPKRELKSKQQILKERVLKEKRREKTGRHKLQPNKNKPMPESQNYSFTSSERSVSLLRTGYDGQTRLRTVEERCDYALALLNTSAIWVPYKEHLVAEWTLNAMWRKGAAGGGVSRGKEGGQLKTSDPQPSGDVMELDEGGVSKTTQHSEPTTIHPKLWSLLRHTLQLPSFAHNTELKPPVLAIYSAALRDMRSMRQWKEIGEVMEDMQHCLTLLRGNTRNFLWAPYDAKCRLAAEGIETLLQFLGRTDSEGMVQTSADNYANELPESRTQLPRIVTTKLDTNTKRDFQAIALLAAANITTDLLLLILEGAKDGTATRKIFQDTVTLLLRPLLLVIAQFQESPRSFLLSSSERDTNRKLPSDVITRLTELALNTVRETVTTKEHATEVAAIVPALVRMTESLEEGALGKRGKVIPESLPHRDSDVVPKSNRKRNRTAAQDELSESDEVGTTKLPAGTVGRGVASFQISLFEHLQEWTEPVALRRSHVVRSLPSLLRLLLGSLLVLDRTSKSSHSLVAEGSQLATGRRPPHEVRHSVVRFFVAVAIRGSRFPPTKGGLGKESGDALVACSQILRLASSLDAHRILSDSAGRTRASWLRSLLSLSAQLMLNGCGEEGAGAAALFESAIGVEVEAIDEKLPEVVGWVVSAPPVAHAASSSFLVALLAASVRRRFLESFIDLVCLSTDIAVQKGRLSWQQAESCPVFESKWLRAFSDHLSSSLPHLLPRFATHISSTLLLSPPESLSAAFRLELLSRTLAVRAFRESPGAEDALRIVRNEVVNKSDAFVACWAGAAEADAEAEEPPINMERMNRYWSEAWKGTQPSSVLQCVLQYTVVRAVIAEAEAGKLENIPRGFIQVVRSLSQAARADVSDTEWDGRTCSVVQQSCMLACWVEIVRGVRIWDQLFAREQILSLVETALYTASQQGHHTISSKHTWRSVSQDALSSATFQESQVVKSVAVDAFLGTLLSQLRDLVEHNDPAFLLMKFLKDPRADFDHELWDTRSEGVSSDAVAWAVVASLNLLETLPSQFFDPKQLDVILGYLLVADKSVFDQPSLSKPKVTGRKVVRYLQARYLRYREKWSALTVPSIAKWYIDTAVEYATHFPTDAQILVDSMTVLTTALSQTSQRSEFGCPQLMEFTSLLSPPRNLTSGTFESLALGTCLLTAFRESAVPTLPPTDAPHKDLVAIGVERLVYALTDIAADELRSFRDRTREQYPDAVQSVVSHHRLMAAFGFLERAVLLSHTFDTVRSNIAKIKPLLVTLLVALSRCPQSYASLILDASIILLQWHPDTALVKAVFQVLWLSSAGIGPTSAVNLRAIQTISTIITHKLDVQLLSSVLSLHMDVLERRDVNLMQPVLLSLGQIFGGIDAQAVVWVEEHLEDFTQLTCNIVDGSSLSTAAIAVDCFGRLFEGKLCKFNPSTFALGFSAISSFMFRWLQEGNSDNRDSISTIKFGSMVLSLLLRIATHHRKLLINIAPAFVMVMLMLLHFFRIPERSAPHRNNEHTISSDTDRVFRQKHPGFATLAERQVSSSRIDSPLSASHSALYTRVLASACVKKNKRSQKSQSAFQNDARKLTKHVIIILAEFATIQASRRPISDGQILTKLRPGLFAVIDLCEEHDLKFLVATADEKSGSRSMLRELIEKWQSEWKYSGQGLDD
ncbi:ATP-dependent RNA helicase dbp10 [Gonapodya sp. JEL0774]|nr:ATP-dependent RNA helicase dbp10 [Gonapodya sp. JEL0774]